jgi:membrane protein YdbS with pleckstrin-like domain
VEQLPPPFENPPLEISSLPRLSDDDFTPLHPRYLVVSLVGMAIFATIVLAAGVIVAVVVGEKLIPLLVMAGVLTIVAIAALMRVLEVRHIAYQVRQHDISYRHGVISRTVSTQPFVRVQHARVNRGPIQRLFGLATVHITAAGSGLVIPGLAEEDAEQIKLLAINRAGDLREDP